MRNIELKARYADLPAARRILGEMGIALAEVQNQLDTYYVQAGARLKVRQIEGKPAELIEYRRPDAAVSRACDYTVVRLDEPRPAMEQLAATHGVRGFVKKRREIYLWHNIRIQLDQVDGLGTFIEFEAVMEDSAGEELAHARIDRLCRRLNIRPADHVPQSYIDLIEMHPPRSASHRP